jgi:hypothetical protein
MFCKDLQGFESDSATQRLSERRDGTLRSGMEHFGNGIGEMETPTPSGNVGEAE